MASWLPVQILLLSATALLQLQLLVHSHDWSPLVWLLPHSPTFQLVQLLQRLFPYLLLLGKAYVLPRCGLHKPPVLAPFPTSSLSEASAASPHVLLALQRLASDQQRLHRDCVDLRQQLSAVQLSLQQLQLQVQQPAHRDVRSEERDSQIS